MRARRRSAPLKKGDTVKPIQGGHLMTITDFMADRGLVVASYSTPDGKRHDEPWPPHMLRRVVVG